MLAGAGVADLRIAALEGGRLPHMLGEAISARAVLLEPVRERVVGPAVARARLAGGAADGEVAVLRISTGGARPGVGEIVALAGTVAPLGRFDAYQRRRGASAAVDVVTLRPTGARRGGVAGIVDAARRRAEAGLVRGLPEPEAALLRGMVLGQDERLGDDVRDDFERSGLAHVLAVSGQNVMLLATLVLAHGRRLRAASAHPPARRARARRALRAAGGRRAVDPARGRDGRRRPRRRARGASRARAGTRSASPRR